MLLKLDSMYEREKFIIAAVHKLKLEYEQLQEDKEMLQNLIMYQSNKNYRVAKQSWQNVIK